MEIFADGGESFAEVAEPLSTNQLSLRRMEDRVEFDDVAFDATGDGADLTDEAGPVRVTSQVDDDVDAHCHGGDDEGRGDVGPGQHIKENVQR